MTKEQIEGFREALKGLSVHELVKLKNDVDEQLEDLYWCDENFYRREKNDSYIYTVVYKDLDVRYFYLGKAAYDRYMKDEDAIRIECKTKDLFPEWKVLMSKGEIEFNEQERIRYQFRKDQVQTVYASFIERKRQRRHRVSRASA